MALKWTDTLEIAIQLSEAHPEIDPKAIRFTDLHQWVMALSEFDDMFSPDLFAALTLAPLQQLAQQAKVPVRSFDDANDVADAKLAEDHIGVGLR